MRAYLRKNNDKIPSKSEEKSPREYVLNLTFIINESGKTINHKFGQLLKYCGFLSQCVSISI